MKKLMMSLLFISTSVALAALNPSDQTPLILHVEAAPESIKTGASVAWYITAAGAEPLHYQWIKNGQVLRGQTKPTLKIKTATSSDAGTYHCVIRNVQGEISTPGYRLHVESEDMVQNHRRSVPAAIRN